MWTLSVIIYILNIIKAFTQIQCNLNQSKHLYFLFHFINFLFSIIFVNYFFSLIPTGKYVGWLHATWLSINVFINCYCCSTDCPFKFIFISLLFPLKHLIFSFLLPDHHPQNILEYKVASFKTSNIRRHCQIGPRVWHKTAWGNLSFMVPFFAKYSILRLLFFISYGLVIDNSTNFGALDEPDRIGIDALVFSSS